MLGSDSQNQSRKEKKRKSLHVVEGDEEEADPLPYVSSKFTMSKKTKIPKMDKAKAKAKTKTKKQKGKTNAPIAELVTSDAEGDHVSIDDDSDSESDCDGDDLVDETRDIKSIFKAEIWQHYNCSVVKKKRRANCKYCGLKVPCHSKRNGTSSAHSHFNSCNVNPHNEKCRLRQTVLNFKPLAPGTSLPSPYLGNWVFNVKEAREAFVKKMIVDEDPFNVYQKPGWKLLAPVALPPYFKLPKRTQLTRDCFSMYEKLKLILKNYFSSTRQRVSLTTDTWTSSNQKLSYMCVTAHYIDSEFVLHKKILSFVQVQSHRGEEMGLALETCIRDDWGIEKVYCITMDNASSNDVLARSLRGKLIRWKTAILDGEHLHMRCAAHIVNLVVSEGLKENFVSVTRVRDCVTYIRRSPMRWLNFLDAAKKEKITSKKHLLLDSPTRWNGAYLMLDRAVHYRAAFERYILIDTQMAPDLALQGTELPTQEDWATVERLVSFLEHFCTLTKKLSGSMYMTSNLILPEISDMFVKIKDLEKSGDVGVSTMATRMLTKFNKYWGKPDKMNMNLFFGVVLDPRHKFEVLSFILENIYGAEIAYVHCSVVKTELARMFEEYLESNTTASSSTDTSGKGSSLSTNVAASSGGEPLVRTMEFFRKQKMNKSANPDKQRTELDKYLAEETEDPIGKFDVLLWWKVNSGRFPILSQLVRDVFAVPVTSVASESAFSTGGRVLSDYRSSLTPYSVQALICAQDWLWPRGVPKSIGEEDIDKLSKIESGEEVENQEEED